MLQSKRIVSLSSVVAAVVLIAALVVSQIGFGPAIAQAQDITATPGTVTVVGEGSVTIEPDIANTTIGVEVVEPSVQDAVSEAREMMDAVIAALQEAGVAEEDLQTSGFNIWAERNFNSPMPMESEGPGNAEQVRYHVSNNVQVTIRDLENIEGVLDAAIQAGANNIYGVNFSLSDPTVIEAEARQKAVENARIKAEELAGLTGTTVGGVVSISEVIGQGGGYFGGNFAAAAREGLGGGGAGPIAPGQLKMTMQLQITYQLQGAE
ncbi:MAG: SIMPL domain-containing protein [Caldilineaceae bacterium]|nr:SIMPL domain-containing protein [Caldilineaceae bacterium]